MSRNTTTAELGIGAVARRSGLSQHTIRIWERRYDAVTPERTDSNRRLYSEEDVARLTLLNRAVQAGHRIGDIAGFPTAKLEKLTSRVRPVSELPGPTADVGSKYIESALAAILDFDAEALGQALSRADVDLGQARALERVIMPLMEQIGTMWKEGGMRIAHEHMATAFVTHHIGSFLANFRYPAHAPALVIATPLGQLHEAGALAAGVVAAMEGWRPLYLGPNLPADEIAGAVKMSGARAVALSLVFPLDDSRLPAELSRLRRLLPDNIQILAGGRAAEAYETSIESGDIIKISDLDRLRSQLDSIRMDTGME